MREAHLGYTETSKRSFNGSLFGVTSMGVQYPEFVDNTEFIQMNSSVPETEQLRAMLNNLTRVHLLTARKFDNLDELIHDYLQCGCEIFSLETGIVSRVDDKGIYHVLDVISPLDVLEPGQAFELNDTYCKEVIKTQNVIGFPEVGRLDYMVTHPVYQNLKLEAYISAPIYVGDQLFGTLNFTSTHARPFGFSSNEYNLILLMANAIGNYILMRSKNERLQELNERMIKFVGFVAHDLRNPIGGIIGLSTLAQRQLNDPEKLLSMLSKMTKAAEDALELINSILDAAALSTGKLTTDIVTVDFSDMAQLAIDSVSDFAKDNQLTIEVLIPQDIRVSCDAKRIQQTLVNLLINAIKYAPEQSTIVLSVEVKNTQEHNQSCRISIKNQVVENTTRNAHISGIYDSVGFGLDIVKTVLKAHHTVLDIEDNKAYYRASFSLPLA